jgi:hypothetical protein
MERMHRHVFALGLSLAAIALMATDSRAALLHPNDTSQFPDASGGFVSGTLAYNASTGMFSMQNTPYALALGTSAASQFDISATPGGLRSETLSVKLNPDGSVNQAGSNTFNLFGQVTINGTTYSGLLLSGTPTAMGSLNLANPPTNVAGSSMFDFDINVKGGLLQNVFGSEAYLRMTAERWSTFNGSFTQDFSAGKIESNIRGFFLAQPAPVPEPTTLVVLVAGGVGIFFRRRTITLERLTSHANS